MTNLFPNSSDWRSKMHVSVGAMLSRDSEGESLDSVPYISLNF